MLTCQRAFEGASRDLLTIADHLGIHQEVGLACRIVRYQSLAVLVNVHRHQREDAVSRSFLMNAAAEHKYRAALISDRINRTRARARSRGRELRRLRA